MVAEFFVPILGGEHTRWAEANRVVFERLLEGMMFGPQGQDYAKRRDNYQLTWLREMAALVGVAPPADNAECVELAEQAAAFITRRVRSAYPGVAEAIRAIHGMEFELFTASGENSLELDGYLTGMGVRGFFRTLYGPDLVNQWKDGAEYYRRIFAHAGVAPERVLVVDDSPRALAWARSVGAGTCLVSASPTDAVEADLVVSRLADLPALIA